MRLAWKLIATLVIMVILSGAFIGWHSGKIADLFAKQCIAGPVFNVAPISPDQFLSITPLGNLSPPDHTIPTDHMYINVKNNLNIDPSQARTVVAPGDITVTQIVFSSETINGAQSSGDYGLTFQPCKQVQVKFGHVTRLSPILAAAYDKHKGSCSTHQSGSNNLIKYCSADLNLKLLSGSLIGQAGGGLPTGLDFQAIDHRQSPHNYANNSRYNNDESRYFACPLDLFPEPVRSQLLSKVGANTQNGLKQRTQTPVCGTIDQDMLGTLQGNWINGGGSMDSPETWAKTMALVHDNFDPSIGVASIGGVIGDPQKIMFVPTHSGSINREWSEITPSSTVYCYQNNHTSGGYQIMTSIFLVELVSAKQLQAEVQSGPCRTNIGFVHPTSYER